MKAIEFITELFKKSPGRCLGNILVNIAMSLFAVGSLFSLGPIIDLFIHPDRSGLSPLTQKAILIMKFLGVPVSLASWMIVFLVFIMISSALQIWGWQLALKMKYALERDVLIGSFEDFFNAKWQFFSSSEQGTIYNSFNRELGQLGNAFSSLGVVFAGLLQVGFFLVVPFMISWKVTLIALAVGAAASSFFVLLGSLAYKIGQKNIDANNKLTSLIYENISGAKLVLGYGNQAQLLKDTDKAFEAILGPTIEFQVLNYAILIAYRPLGVFVVGVAIIAAKWFSVPLSEVAILLLALFQVMISFGNVIGQKNSIMNMIPSYEQILALRKKAQMMRQENGQRIFPGFQREICLQDLSFSHPGHPKVLDEINLVIPKGKMIAFVGKSGAGKSTMIDMLMGFHQPEKGEVTVDGINLFEYDLCSYRKRLGYVPQESLLFNMSIRENLLWASPGATLKSIEEACQQAYADEFIASMPKGYDTITGDRGVRLSGGQIQRLALARAFLRKPDILILDEATSSLDSHSEQLIQKAIEAFAEISTVIIVAHRLTTIKRADIIYVLNEGRIIEQGSYIHLTAQKGIFTGMVQLQELGLK